MLPGDTSAADAHADRLKRQALATAAAELGHLPSRVVDGELRYYVTPTTYTPAAVRPGGKRRWFETRSDGDYPIKPPTIDPSRPQR